MRHRLRRLFNVLILALGVPGCSDKQSGASDGPPGKAGEQPPVDAAALVDWLNAGRYDGYAGEPVIHASAGPHNYVRVFFDDLLQTSRLTAEAKHPVGSAAVKELHDKQDGPLTGWALSIKLADTGAKEDWLWYQLALGDDAPSVNKPGQAICASCHQAGTDYVLSELPAP